jgi:hypothetical protein
MTTQPEGTHVTDEQQTCVELSCIRPVLVHVTSQVTGAGLVVPYEHGRRRPELGTYEVPLYEMYVSGKDRKGKSVSHSFNVIRFGIKSDSTSSTVGLKDQQSHTLKRVPYMGGSWQIYGNWLVHEGAEYPGRDAFGALGCIEVTGPGSWQDFENRLLELSGARSADELGKSGRLKIKIDHVATRPTPQQRRP